MDDVTPLFGALRNSADPQVVAAIEALIADGTDRQLCRVNVLTFAAERGLDEEKAVGGFLHAARLGLFELSWNVLCPGCGGVLDATQTLKTVRKEAYDCALCNTGYEPTLDEMVEVSFTVNPRVRRIAAHDPQLLPRLGILPPDILGLRRRPARGRLRGHDRRKSHSIRSSYRPAKKRRSSLQLPEHFLIVFEPVTHAAHFIDVKGEPTKDRQTLSLIYNKAQRQDRDHRNAPGTLAAGGGKPHRDARAALGVDRRHRAARPARQAPALPDRQAAADQPDLPRHLSHRHARRRSEASSSPA